jgi:hypothetical protein
MITIALLANAMPAAILKFFKANPASRAIKVGSTAKPG